MFSSVFIVICVFYILPSAQTLSYYDEDNSRYLSSTPNLMFRRLFRFAAPEPPAYESSEEVYHGDKNGRDFHEGQIMFHRSQLICPEEQDRYDPITESCQTIGTTGSCGRYMIFTGNEYLNPDDRMFGHCECDSSRFDRPLVSVGGQCHFLYTQAICDPGYWLTLSKTLGPVCKPNPCSKKMSRMTSDSPVVYFHGECVKLYSTSRFCPRKNDVVMFPKGSSSSEPICSSIIKSRSRRIFRRQVAKTSALMCSPCPNGQIRYSSACKCRRVLSASAFV